MSKKRLIFVSCVLLSIASVIYPPLQGMVASVAAVTSVIAASDCGLEVAEGEEECFPQ